MTVSAITSADEAFTVLASPPAPLAFDARGIHGLPDRARWIRCPDLHEVVELLEDIPVEASIPRAPYGHPDLLLGCATAAGIITADEATLIGDTRIGGVLVEELADQQGVSAPVLRMRRHRAEKVLVGVLRRGDTGPHNATPATGVRSSSDAVTTGAGTLHTGRASTTSSTSNSNPVSFTSKAPFSRQT